MTDSGWTGGSLPPWSSQSTTAGISAIADQAQPGAARGV